MTVSNSNNRTRLAVNAAEYDFTFRIDDESEILVYLINTVDDEEIATLQTLTTNYTVTISTITEGGTVSFQESDGLGGYDPVTPDCDEVLMIRNKPYTQVADIPVRGGFNERTIELALDNLAMQVQQVKDLIDYDVTSDPVAVASASASASAAAASAVDAETAQAAAEVAQAAAEVAQAAAEASGVAAVNDALDTVTGHDHDGSDSKKVSYVDLDMSGITDGHYLYNNNGTPAGAAIVAPALTLVAVKTIASGGTQTIFSGLTAQKVYKLMWYFDNASSNDTVYLDVNGTATFLFAGLNGDNNGGVGLGYQIKSGAGSSTGELTIRQKLTNSKITYFIGNICVYNASSVYATLNGAVIATSDTDFSALNIALEFGTLSGTFYLYEVSLS